jgi:hypothetical protein
MRHVARYTSLVLEISPYFGADRGASIGQEWSAVGRGVDFDAAVVGAGPASRDQRYGEAATTILHFEIWSFRSTCLTTRGGR